GGRAEAQVKACRLDLVGIEGAGGQDAAGVGKTGDLPVGQDSVDVHRALPSLARRALEPFCRKMKPFRAPSAARNGCTAALTRPVDRSMQKYPLGRLAFPSSMQRMTRNSPAAESRRRINPPRRGVTAFTRPLKRSTRNRSTQYPAEKCSHFSWNCSRSAT